MTRGKVLRNAHDEGIPNSSDFLFATAERKCWFTGVMNHGL
jgi:hypothetical protein